MKQIFIFALPRSGSTLLQRVLMSNSTINSTAEPWLLLPQIYAIRNEGQLSEYGSLPASRAINDVIKNLPKKEEDYFEAIRNFTNEIQNKLTNDGEVYFLDKTPRYYLIINEIVKIFPEAKFIFLFRSPEQIYASMLKTWGDGRLKNFLSSYYDLVNGYKLLSDGYKKICHKSISIKYEEFVLNPDLFLKNLSEYLEIDIDKDAIKNFSKQDTKGRLGDPTGVKDYNTISEKSIHKWKKTINTKIKRRVAISLIHKIDKEDLLVQGYNRDIIINNLKSIEIKKFNFGLIDLWDYFLDLMTRKLNLQIFFSKDFKWSRKKYLS